MLRFEWRQARRAMAVCIVLLEAFSVGCSDGHRLNDPDAAAPGTDAPAKSDGSLTDATPIDAIPDAPLATDGEGGSSGDAGGPATPDARADVDCTCTIDAKTIDASFQRGIKSLACHCATYVGGCVPYETTLSMCRASPLHSLEFYDACNLMVIRFQGTYAAGGQNVYDTTTRELVGVSVSTDTPAYACGGRFVIAYSAGRFPAPECELSRRWPGCMSGGDDGGNDSSAQVRSSM